MMELIGLLIGHLIVSEREWIIATLLPPVELRARTDNEPDWIHSVTRKYADPEDDYRAGYIDRREYAARMMALKRFITPGLIGPAFANHERVVRSALAE